MQHRKQVRRLHLFRARNNLGRVDDWQAIRPPATTTAAKQSTQVQHKTKQALTQASKALSAIMVEQVSGGKRWGKPPETPNARLMPMGQSPAPVQGTDPQAT